MFLNSFIKTKEELSLVIDIQSGLIRGALILNKENTEPHILFVVTRPIIHKPHTDSTYLTKAMLKTLSEVVDMLGQEGVIRAQALGYNKKLLSRVHYILSSPWVLSSSKTLKIHFDKDTEITEKFVQNLLEEERMKIEDKFKESNHNFSGQTFNTDLVFIEHKIFEMKLNGYKVNKYDGRKASSLEISFAATLSSNRLINRINSEVKKILNLKKIEYHSALLLNFIAMRLIVPEKNNFISIHVHNELTDVVVVKDGLASHLASFPFGTSTLLRKISAVLGESRETSESTLTLLFSDKLEASQAENLKNKIKPLIQHWYREYVKSIDYKDDNTFSPKTIYLSAHSHVEIFKRILKANNDSLDVIIFDITNTDMHVVFEKIGEYNQLIGMYALALKNMV
jgi:hypothetical protein